MKKIFSFASLLILVMSLYCNNSFSQFAGSIAYHKAPNLSEPINKLSTEKAGLSKLDAGRINARILRTFIDTYSDTVSNVKWYAQDNNFMADFWQNDKWTKSFFTRKGNFICSFAFGTEKNLPRELRKQLKSVYVDYNIGRVAEMCSHGKITYIVNIDNEDKLIQVKMIDGSMEEIANYIKSK